MVEEGWECYPKDGEYIQSNKDKSWYVEDGEWTETEKIGSYCIDRRPIGFIVTFQTIDQYTNENEQSPISLQLAFNKTFYLPPGKSLQDYL